MGSAEEQTGMLTQGIDQKQCSLSTPPLFTLIFTSPHHEELRNVSFKLTEGVSEKEISRETDGREDILKCFYLLKPR